MPFEPGVWFVVVNWNQRQLTLDCLASLREQAYPSFHVALVDNGSQDGTPDAVRQAFPDVTVIVNDRNLGFAAGNNVGIQHALAAGAEYVFLLNNDTTVDPQMLGRLVDVAESDPTIGITGPTMLYLDAPETIWCAGNRIDWSTGSTERLRADMPVASVEQLAYQDVDFITACAVCIKRAVFADVGLLDERFFMYYEETDWFARAAAAGWRTVYVPSARMWHKVSATIGATSPLTDYYMIRNRYLFLGRNLAGARRIAALLRAGLYDARTVAAYTVKSHGGARLRNRDAKLLGMRDAALRRWGQIDSRLAATLSDRPA